MPGDTEHGFEDFFFQYIKLKPFYEALAQFFEFFLLFFFLFMNSLHHGPLRKSR